MLCYCSESKSQTKQNKKRPIMIIYQCFFDDFVALIILYRISFFNRINFLTLAAKLPPSQYISEQVPPPLTPQLRPVLSHDAPAATFHNSIAGARGVWQRYLLVCHRNLHNLKRQHCLRDEGNTSETHPFPPTAFRFFCSCQTLLRLLH